MLAVIWNEWIQTLNLSEETYNNHYKWVERWINHFDPEWTDTDWLLRISNSPKTVNRYIAHIKKCIDWALDEGLIKGKNSYKNLVIKSRKVKEERKGFTEEEKKKVLEEFRLPTCDSESKYWETCHYHDMVVFWFESGLRVGEVIGLKRKDFDILLETVKIRRSRTRDHSNVGKGHALIEKTTKTGRTRVLPLTPTMLQVACSVFSKAGNKKRLVFTKPDGAAIDMGNWRRRVWKPALERAGVPYQPPKNIRHTLLTEAANDPRIGVVGAAKIAGHTTTKTVQENYIGLHGDVILPSSE